MKRCAIHAAIGLVLVLGLACGGGSEKKELTLEGLLAATLSPNDIGELFPQTEDWWPTFPEYNIGFDPAPTEIAGDRFWVAQNYQRVDDSANELVQTALTLFDSESAAEEGLAAIADSNDQDSTTVAGPTVGDESRYFTRETADDSDPMAPPPFETTLRFRVGPVVGRMSMFSDQGYEEPESLARLFAPVEERIHAFVAGELEAVSLPEWMSELMPSSAAAEAARVGPVFGSAVRPPQSWALIDTTGDPPAVLDKLEELGTTELGLRRYGLDADPDLVVEIVLFQMADEDATASWVQDFLDSATSELALTAGKTGVLSGFTSYDGSMYELQFAKGRLAGDVACFAPFGETSEACEEPVRLLAEHWYAELPE